MSRRKNKVQDILNLKEINKNQELKRNSIQMNEIEKDIYHDLVDNYEQMQENLQEGLNEYAPFADLSEDLFGSLFKPNVKMNDEADMHSFTRFNHAMVEEILDTEEYKTLHKSTKYDQLGSAIGTEVLQQQAMDKIKYFKQQYQHKQQTGEDVDGASAGELIDKLNQMAGVQDQIDDLLDSVGGDSTQLTQQEAEELAKLQEILNQMRDEIEYNADGQEELKDG